MLLLLPLLSNFSGVSPSSTLPCHRPHHHHNHNHRSNCSTYSTPTCHLSLGFEDLTAITHNKVLVAATVSTAVGQLAKPFTSALLYGDPFDFKAAVRSGGFPSTHSSAVAAAATSLGLERGFSDSIFGLTIVYAALVMYDAQGVRREVGKHAKTINKVLLESRSKSTTSSDEEDNTSGEQADIVKGLGDATESGFYLYERVGHTEWEVLAGALFGVIVSLTVFVLT